MSNPVFLEELLAQSADGAFIVDHNQRIVAWNPAAEKLLGFMARDVIGQPCYQILGGRAEGAASFVAGDVNRLGPANGTI